MHSGGSWRVGWRLDPMQVKIRVCAIGFVFATVFSLAPSSHAAPLRASVGVGAAAPEIADPVAYLGGVSLVAYFDDSFGGYFGLWGMSFPAKPADTDADYDSAWAGSLGVEYRINVARSVPYLRAGGGIIAAAGNPSLSAPMVELGVGMRWRLSEGVDLGVEIGRYEPMDDLGGIGGGVTMGIELGVQFEF
jgi:hypothetical protein